MLEGFTHGPLAPSGVGRGVLTFPNGFRVDAAAVGRLSALHLFATSNQVVFQADGVTGTLTWTPTTSGKTLTLPNVTGTLITTGDTGTVAIPMLASATGLTAGAVGDLLYCGSTTPTWSRLAAVATGQVLVSAGVGVAPAWATSPTLTALTLSVGGGSGTTPSPFANRLVITANATQGLSVNVPDTGQGLIVFGSPSNATYAYLQATYNAGSPLLETFTLNTSRLKVGLGIQIGTPTGGDKGAGTLNTQGGYYAGGTAGVTHTMAGSLTALATLGGLVTTFTSSSDARLKRIADGEAGAFTRGLADLRAVRPIRYRWNAIARDRFGFDDAEHVGFSAQNVEPTMPEAVGTETWADGRTWKTFADRVVLAAAVNALRELDDRVAALEAKGASDDAGCV